jgi:hypothetical protein
MSRYNLCALVVFVAVGLLAPSPASAQEIQIGRPKVWLYDRLYPNLDGLLRDTEGISLASLSGLDPNALNARVVDFLQSVIQASINADQTAAVQNAAAESLFKASQGLLGTQTAAAQALSAQKLNLLQSLAQAMDAQQMRIAALPSGTTCGNDPQCQQLQQNVADLNALWTALGNASTAVGTPGTLSPPSLTGVIGTAGNAPALAGIVDPKTFLTTALGSTGGSLPPREQLENFITLLNDRLTKQLALSLDEDGLRGDYVPVVAEFDVSINPLTSRKNQTAVAEFKLISTTTGCSGGQPIVYNLYPSLSAFNVADVQGKSSAFMLNGGIKGLFVGGSGSYQREHDRVTQALRQSVYMSGFRNGQSQVGWVYRAPAFTSTIRPGMYSTFAVVLVPRGCGLDVQRAWHWNKKGGKQIDPEPMSDFSPAAAFSILQTDNQPTITHVQYDPHYASADDLQTDVNVITVDFERPINPNLMIAAAGKLLKRVRDWRGRATLPGTGDTISVTDSAGNTRQVSRARGLFEADIDEADTWIAVTQTKIMLKLKYATAGSIVFPEIRLLTPGGETWSLQQLVDYKHYTGRVAIGQREFLACHPKANAALSEPNNEGCMRQPESMWLPLFVVQPSGAHTLRLALTSADAPDNSGMAGQVYFFVSADDGRTALSPRAQVVLAQPGHMRFPHPIPVECSGLMGGLLCHTHPQSILYGALPCMNAPLAGTQPVLNTGSEECKIEKYSLLRVEVTQPGTKANPTFYAVAALPLPPPGTPATLVPVVGAASGFSQGALLHYTFPVYGLPAGTPVQLLADGSVLAGATAAVVADAATGMPIVTADVQESEAAVGPILAGSVHLYANGADLGPLAGMREAIVPTDLELTIQGRFYQFAGSHLDAVREIFVGNQSKPITRYDSGILTDIGDAPPKDELLSFNIAGARRPVVACVTRTKVAETPSANTPPKAADQGKTPAPAADAGSLEVTTTTKVKTGSGSTAQAAATSPDTHNPPKPAVAPETERVCGPIVVAAAPKGPAKLESTAAAAAVLMLAAPTPMPAPTQSAPQDAAKQIYPAPEPVRK